MGCTNWGSIQSELERRVERQRAYFDEGEGSFLFFGSYGQGRRPVPHPPYGVPVEYLPDGSHRPMSEEYLKNHAFDIGVRIARNVKVEAANQMAVADDSCPCPLWLNLGIDIGTGATTALFTGQRVVFAEITSFTPAEDAYTWQEIEDLRFNPDNRYIQFELDMWRGVESEYEPGLPVITHQLRSPLDLANAIRGNQLFLDLYDNPDRVDALLDKCVELTAEYERFARSEIPLFADAPGGCCGVALPRPVLFINGDPVDLISPVMGDRFNKPPLERLAERTGAIYFHHHSIGVSRAPNVSTINGLVVQEIIQDPNGPMLSDSLLPLVEPSKRVPIHLHMRFGTDGVDLFGPDELVRVLDQLQGGRFIIQVRSDTVEELDVETARAYG